MSIQLVTDQITTDLDDDLREKLVSNFKIIQQAVNDLEEIATGIKVDVGKDKVSQNADLIKKLDDMKADLTQRINRITMGTDEDTVRSVVTAILKEQEVIK